MRSLIPLSLADRPPHPRQRTVDQEEIALKLYEQGRAITATTSRLDTGDDNARQRLITDGFQLRPRGSYERLLLRCHRVRGAPDVARSLANVDHSSDRVSTGGNGPKTTYPRRPSHDTMTTDHIAPWNQPNKPLSETAQLDAP
ncbi:MULTISPECIES: hypothetical protein [unclassified Microbacterium]|uniref:hypothetical protein n=1 Tax=unclassified Microbacterium TaxID=2609290 RepID=UPI00301B6139